MHARLLALVALCALLPASVGCLHHCPLLCGTGMGCGAEVGCGVDVGCCDCPGGRGEAFKKWKCGSCEGPKICVCTGPDCCDSPCGGGCCDPVCGCAEPACGCEPACGAEVGCCDTCSDGCCGFGFGKVCSNLIGKLCGCGGCDGELYWSEWCNDPPRCCDPCDKCGNWVGPSGGSYRAPYATPCPTCN